MKILFAFLLLISSWLGRGTPTVRLEENDAVLELVGTAHVLMDYDSGEVLYQDHADQKLYPASMTKMMGMILVLEAVDRGDLKWDEEVSGSPESSGMGGTQIFLAPNEKMRAEDLFKAVAINSANDAIVALGERVSGSHEAFVKKMNERAKELGMTGTHFVNATGFDDPDHYVTAMDMAICGRELLSHQEDILRFTRLKESYIRTDTDNPFWLVNTNKLLGNYDGLDGLKTGYTNLAGYNLTATAQRSGIRLISVTMKAPTIKDRSQDTVKLLNYGFSKLERFEIFKADTELATFDFDRALKKGVPLFPAADINPVYPKGTDRSALEARIEMSVTSAPIASGTVVGTLIISGPKTPPKSYPVVVREDVEAASFLDYLLASLQSYLF